MSNIRNRSVSKNVEQAMLQAGCIALYEELKQKAEGDDKAAKKARALVGASDALYELGFKVFPCMVGINPAREEPYEFAAARLLKAFRTNKEDSEERVQEVAWAWFESARALTKRDLVEDEFCAKGAHAFLRRSDNPIFKGEFGQSCNMLGFLTNEDYAPHYEAHVKATQEAQQQAG